MLDALSGLSMVVHIMHPMCPMSSHVPQAEGCQAPGTAHMGWPTP
jgi:hypothetical protein